MGRGVVSDQAKKLSDVIDRIKASDKPEHELPPFMIAGCNAPHCACGKKENCVFTISKKPWERT